MAKTKTKKTVKKTKTNKVKSQDTLVSFLLDETGSMGSCKTETISGFNEYLVGLRKDKKLAKKTTFTLTKFDSSKIEAVHNGVPLKDVDDLNERSFRPGSMTNLYDAIGRTIKSVDEVLDKAGKNKPAVLFVVMTDGEENSSREYTSRSINDLIKAREKDGWGFVYLGANHDSWNASRGLGFSKGNTVDYHTSNTKGAMAGAACVTTSYRTTRSLGVQCDVSNLVPQSAREEIEDPVGKK